jgi:hypothetical protein
VLNHAIHPGLPKQTFMVRCEAVAYKDRADISDSVPTSGQRTRWLSCECEERNRLTQSMRARCAFIKHSWYLIGC